MRTHRPPPARPAAGARPQARPGAGVPKPTAHGRPRPDRGSRGAHGRRGGPATLRPAPEPLGGGKLSDPRPPGREAAARPRLRLPRYLPSCAAAADGASSCSEGSERLPSAGRPWPAPYVKRRRLRRHSRRAGGGAPRPLRSVTRQLASAPRQPGAFHILPPRRRDYISAPAPPWSRPSGRPRGRGRGRVEGWKLEPTSSAGRRPLRRGAWGCSLQKPLNSDAAPAPARGVRLELHPLPRHTLHLSLPPPLRVLAWLEWAV